MGWVTCTAKLAPIQNYHITVRKEVVKYMEDHAERYTHLVDEEFDYHIRQQKCTDGRVSSWATEAEVQASADRYGIDIMVATDRKFETWNRFVCESEKVMPDKTVSIRLLLENSHFSLVNEVRPQESNISKINCPATDWFNSSGFDGHCDCEHQCNCSDPNVPESTGLCNQESEKENALSEEDFSLNHREKGEDTPIRSQCQTNDTHEKSRVYITTPITLKNTKKQRSKRKPDSSKCQDRNSKTKLIDEDKPSTVPVTKRNCKAKNNNKNKKLSVSVTNLSKCKLSNAQISLLEKGLKFIPSKNKIDKLKLISDLCEWERRMRLIEYFYDENEKDDKDERVSERFQLPKKSYFTPNKGRDSHLDLDAIPVKVDN